MTDFASLIDLASEKLGGEVLAANDEFFAPKENLVKLSRPVWIDDRYTDRGKWMDGWETRRRREPGHDWAILRLGLPGRIRGFIVDTAYFKGNYPESCSIDGCDAAADVDVTGAGVGWTAMRVLTWISYPLRLNRIAVPGARSAPKRHCETSQGPCRDIKGRALDWFDILPRTPLAGHTENRFAVECDHRVTHLRLNIFPDGGVARLRVYGRAVPDRARLRGDRLIDLAAVEQGGLVVGTSDMFFGSAQNLIMPGDSGGMHDGWETKRRRGPGHDWAIVELGAPGLIQRLVVDTTHYKGNAPGSCSVEVCFAPGADATDLPETSWHPLLPQTPLSPHTRHEFDARPRAGAATHVRLNIYPDGGVSRFRVFGIAVGPT